MPYFFEIKTDFFYSKNNPKIIYLSYKTDLEIFKEGLTRILANFHWTDLVICSHSREGKICLIAE